MTDLLYHLYGRELFSKIQRRFTAMRYYIVHLKKY